MEPAQKPDKPLFFDAAFVVPFSILIAYFWALSLTIGIYNYFNVPVEFISLNPTNVLAQSREYLATIAFVMLGCLVVPLFLGYIAEKNVRLGYWILVCLVVLGIFQMINKAFNPRETLRWSIGICLTVFVVVIAVCMNNLIPPQERISKEKPSNSFFSTQFWNYVAILIALGAIVGGYWIFYFIGRSMAQDADTFYLVKQSGGGKEDAELVFLGTYGDYLVVVPFHRDTKRFEGFVILKMPQAENTRLTFTPEKVGRLQPVEVKSAEAKP